MSRTHLVIPDVQAKPGHDFAFLTQIGNYIVEKKPDVLIQIGDFADMEALSSYDTGKKCFEGRRVQKDIQAAKDAMEALMAPIHAYNDKAKRNKEKLYKPEMHLTLGNHEERILRAVNDDPKLDGILSIDQLEYEKHGWTVHTFLKVIQIDGVCYSHYFTTGAMGKPAGSAQALISKKHQSCIAGHQQGRQMATAFRADGSTITCIIAGSAYPHDEKYMGPQGNDHWRGILVLHEVRDGMFDEMFVSLDFLKKRYS